MSKRVPIILTSEFDTALIDRYSERTVISPYLWQKARNYIRENAYDILAEAFDRAYENDEMTYL